MRPMKPRDVGGPHEMLVEAMAEIGVAAGDPAHGVEAAANFLGLSHWTLRKQMDPDQGGDVGFVRLVQLAAHFKLTSVAHYFAALAGGMFVPLLPTGADPRWGELTAETNESMGAFVAEILRDMADGEIDSVEAGRALKLHTELLRLHARLHAHLRAIHSKKDKT